MTTTNRHEPAAERGLAPRSGPVADVNGTSVPRHSDPIYEHWDEAYRLGYTAALDAARIAIAPIPTGRYAIADALIAIDALREGAK